MTEHPGLIKISSPDNGNIHSIAIIDLSKAQAAGFACAYELFIFRSAASGATRFIAGYTRQAGSGHQADDCCGCK
jgi:hypothetical protein